MLVELALRGRLQLEASGVRRKSLLARKVRTIILRCLCVCVGGKGPVCAVKCFDVVDT